MRVRSKCGKDDLDVKLDPNYVRWKDTGKQLEDEEAIELMASIVKQAAKDYRVSVKWLMKHEKQNTSKKYHIVERLRDDVIKFSKSYLFSLVFEEVLDSKQFLMMAVKGQI